MRTWNITGNFKNRYRINDFQHKPQKATEVPIFMSQHRSLSNNPAVMYLQQSRINYLCTG